MTVINQGFPTPGARALKVLIVDDNTASALSLNWIVESHGDTAMTCHDGITAVAEAVLFLPDVVLLDLGMRGMNGFEVCHALRADPRFADTLIIAHTGWGEDVMRARTQAAGFDLHMTKPIDTRQLLRTLNDRRLARYLAA